MIRNGTCPTCTHHSIDWHLLDDGTLAKVCRRTQCTQEPYGVRA